MLKYLKPTLPYLYILGVAFFSLIFLMRLIIQDHLDDTVKSLILIKDNQISGWGKIPGKFEYTYIKNLTFYSTAQKKEENLATSRILTENSTAQPESLSLYKQDTLNFSIARNYVNTEYYPQQTTVGYNENYVNSYGGDEKNLTTNNYTHLNMAGLSLWYQMNNKPDFWKSFQALVKVRQQFANDFYYKFIAFHSYNYVFKSKDLTYKTILAGLPQATADSIYTDKVFGMDSVSKLYYWMSAYGELNTTNSSYTQILSYFQSQGLDFKNGDMDKILSQRNLISQMFQTLTNQLICAVQSGYGLQGLDLDNLFQTQWSTLSVVQNTRYALSTTTPNVITFKDLDPENINYIGEFAYYVTYVEKNTVETQLNIKSVANFFKFGVTSASFMNPANLLNFFEKYQDKDYNAIMKTFSVGDYSQIDSLMGYFKYMIANALEYQSLNGTYEHNVYARLMLKTMNETYSQIKALVPFELTSRYLAAYFQVNGKTCIDYISKAVEDKTQQNQICLAYSFDDINKVQSMLKATYYGGSYLDTLKNNTNMTDAQIAILFNKTDPDSFQTAFLSQSQIIHDLYSCSAVATNCTDDELAQIQWGSSNLTLTVYAPYKANTYLSTLSDSVTTSWGLMPTQPEFFYYQKTYLSAEKQFTLNSTQVKVVMNNITGINSDEAATLFVIKVMTGQDLTMYQTNLGIANASDFFTVIRYIVQEYIMGGTYSDLSIDQWLNGYESGIFDVITQGNFFEGNDKDLIKQINPVFNGLSNDIMNEEIRIHTGSGNAQEVAKVKQINEKPYINKLSSIYNGTKSVDLAVNYWDQRVELTDITNGMQFQPETNDGTIAVFENLLQRHIQYTYDSDDKVENSANGEYTSVKTFKESTFSNTDSVLKASAQGTLHVGPAFNLQLVIAKQGCSACNSSMLNALNIDGENYTSAVPKTDVLQTQIEGTSGFMLNSKKQLSYFLYLNSELCLPFPDLDKIGKQLVPLYDVNEELTIDIGKFQDLFGFIEFRNRNKAGVTISFIVLSAVCLIVAILGTLIVVFKGKKDEETSEGSGSSKEEKSYTKQ